MEPKFNKFVTFKLSPEEEQVATTFHPLQSAYLQNERAAVAEEILTLKFDSQDPIKYGLAKAELQGKLLMLDQILAQSHLNQQEAEPQPQET